ncbi:MAG: ribulose bisphosphate carboxylase small subunit [Cyanobacteria bacterium]|nr:ribulose bisphosphate carboxylase small subunit [Cyanobacteriota bacterium]
MTYYLSPRYLDKIALHITKNYLNLPKVPVPLILGIHGKKGEGKTFQCNLVFERMGIEAVHVSGGELESPDAGDPARLLRLRYREASELVKVRGRMAVLLINDLDAGAGRFDGLTQYTVNTQLVNATLMNIADNPTNVQLPGSYDAEPVQRIPIVVTGNDFGTLYAPLTRDGRMEKFYWEPLPQERAAVVDGIFEGAGLGAQLVERFPEQSIDFFGAIKSRLYDESVRQLLAQVGVEGISDALVKNRSKGLPAIAEPTVSMERLVEIGTALVREQERIGSLHLASRYNPHFESRSDKQGGSANGSAHGSVNGRGRSRAYATDAELETVATVPGDQHSKDQDPGHQDPRDQDPTVGRPLTPATRSEVRAIVSNGFRLGIEYADRRHFKMNSWQCYGIVDPYQEGAAIAQVERCLGENADGYVRLVAIDPDRRTRLRDTIISRP